MITKLLSSGYITGLTVSAINANTSVIARNKKRARRLVT